MKSSPLCQSPITPSKSPASKKGKLVHSPTSATAMDTSDVVLQLSQLINSRSDVLEKLISDNTLQIKGLKKTIDFACAKIKDINKGSAVLEKCICNDEARLD
ncbi:Iota-carrageenase [Labeo rohita]|uniref:Iota-carrageenase n=1 Tax=Labeo rohita TaxID=84645 RepID=A0ABQ8MVM9_LABRO|nr:Iota-carrageenase [Labeo rohita]